MESINITNINTFADLINFIAKQYSELPLKEIAKKKIGISEKSFFDIKRGKMPHEKLQRVLKSFVEKNYGFSFNQSDSNGVKINIIKKVVNVNGDHSSAAGRDNIIKGTNDQLSYLVDRIITLETNYLNTKQENELLKKKIKEYAANKRKKK